MWKREDTIVKWFSSITYTWVLQVELGIGRQGKLFYPPRPSACSEDLVDVCHLCAACRPCLSQPRCFLPILNCCMHGMGLPPSRSPPRASTGKSPRVLHSLADNSSLSWKSLALLLLFSVLAWGNFVTFVLAMSLAVSHLAHCRLFLFKAVSLPFGNKFHTFCVSVSLPPPPPDTPPPALLDS